MSNNNTDSGRRVIRIRRVIHNQGQDSQSIQINTKIIPDSLTGHIMALAKPNQTPGEQYAAEFLKLTPLPFQLYFCMSAIAKPLSTSFMHLWSDVEMYEWKNQHIRWMLKRLILFRTHYTDTVNETDVGAMIPISEIPHCDKIYFFDSCERRQYIMHAQTATNILRMALEHQDHMFPTPHGPKNPYTNNPFNIGQLATIYSQLNLRYERLPLSLVMFRTAGFDMNRFERHYGAHLRWKAIDSALRDRDLRGEMMCTTLEAMYRETFAPSFAFLIDDFAILEGETRDVLYELAREYMELFMSHVIRNSFHPTIEIILHVFRVEVMKRIINPHLLYTTHTITTLLAQARNIAVPLRPPPPPPVNEAVDVSGDVIEVRELPQNSQDSSSEDDTQLIQQTNRSRNQRRQA